MTSSSTLLIDGKTAAIRVRAEVAQRCSNLVERGVRPCLVVVLVGSDPASQVYVVSKDRAAREAGLLARTVVLDASIKQQALEDVVSELNDDLAVHGILVQMPLPSDLDGARIIDRISPAKDVDGLHPVNAGRLALGRSGHVPCTPLGVLRLLADNGFVSAGKTAVVIGRSELVGRPLATLLSQRASHGDATVTLAHSRSRDLPEIVRTADLVVAAVGRPRMVQGNWLKPGAWVIDVGINRIADSTATGGTRLVGDVDETSCLGIAAALTPVPGGVGPMTIAMLLSNTLDAAAWTLDPATSSPYRS